MYFRKHHFPGILALFIACFLVMISCDFARPVPVGLDTKTLELSTMPNANLKDYLKRLDSSDPMLVALADPSQAERVHDFCSVLTGSEKVASAILSVVKETGISPALAFALAFEESSFNPAAVNHNHDSTDRGLFQLNSKSFPAISEKDAFDPLLNSRTALQHLGLLLKQGGNEVAALAMYNAGHGRVKKTGTPKATLDYIARIQTSKKNILELFAARVTTARNFVRNLSIASTIY